MIDIGNPWIKAPELINTIPLPESEEPITITVRIEKEKPKIFVEGSLASTPEKFSVKIDKGLKDSKEKKILILSDENVGWDHIRKILRLLKEKKLYSVAFVSEDPARGYDLILYEIKQWGKRSF